MNTPDERAPERSERETTLRIRTLNDTFRTTFLGGRVLLTAGVQGLGETDLRQVVEAVQTFDAFTPENDPYGEHDFGAVTVEGVKVFWKIDYYDRAMECGSEDPGDPEQTCRVLTIMLAEEY